MAKNKHWPEKFPPAIVHDLKGTEDFLEKIFTEREYEVVSTYPTLSGSPMTLKRGHRCFEFYDAQMQRGSHQPVQYQSESYGLQKPFLLKSEEFELEAYNGAGEISIALKGFIFSGKLWELRTRGISSYGYFRYIFPIRDFFKKPLSFLLGKPFATDQSYRAAGYSHLNLNDKTVGMFDYEIAGQSSLIIECYNRIHANDLWEIVQAIRYSFGFVSGNLLHDEMIRLEYPDESFNTVIGFELQKLRDSVHSIAPMKPDLLREYRKHLGLSHLHSETHFPESTFEKLVQMCLSDPQLLRACKLMAESGEHTLEIKASTYSVALETLKNIILIKNEEKINPFKNRKKASKIMASLKEIIEHEDESSFNNKKMILKKIEQLNQVGNRDGFLLAFKLLGIHLNEDDKRCINMRNDFLHGRIPFEDERQEDDPRLVHIVFKLHLLVSCLILKHCGYSGPVLNQIKLTDLFHFNNQLQEPLFRKI